MMLIHLNLLLTIITFISDVVAISYYKAKYGPKHIPTQGEPWPKPKEQETDNEFYVFSGNDLVMFKDEHDCHLLKAVEDRFHTNMKKLYKYADPTSTIKSYSNEGMLEKILIKMTEPCEEYPHYKMQESYELEVSRTVTLNSNSIWGVMRGLETLLQLFYLKNNVLIINGTKIVDSPTYSHRGLMLDTARHYIPVNKILTTLDAMAFNKMNVLHWHIIDEESFPFVSNVYPCLSKKGAYYPSMIYNPAMIREVVQFATIRGIRVIPEFSIPGRTKSSKCHPEIIKKCYNNFEKEFSWGLVEPTKKGTYSFLTDLLIEIQSLFPDNMIHLGGEDLYGSCWRSNPRIRFHPGAEKSRTVGALSLIFLELVRPILKENSVFIVWQDAVNFDVKNESLWFKNMIVQTYDGDSEVSQLQNLPIIYSEFWDLGDLKRNKFKEMYISAKEMTGDPKYIGGEALLWGNDVDDTNIISRAWPLTSAAAEVLWNPGLIDDMEKKSGSTRFNSVYQRLSEHTCRMIKLGIAASPITGASVCDDTIPDFIHRKELEFQTESIQEDKLYSPEMEYKTAETNDGPIDYVKQSPKNNTISTIRRRKKANKYTNKLTTRQKELTIEVVLQIPGNDYNTTDTYDKPMLRRNAENKTISNKTKRKKKANKHTNKPTKCQKESTEEDPLFITGNILRQNAEYEITSTKTRGRKKSQKHTKKCTTSHKESTEEDVILIPEIYGNTTDTFDKLTLRQNVEHETTSTEIRKRKKSKKYTNKRTTSQKESTEEDVLFIPENYGNTTDLIYDEPTLRQNAEFKTTSTKTRRRNKSKKLTNKRTTSQKESTEEDVLFIPENYGNTTDVYDKPTMRQNAEYESTSTKTRKRNKSKKLTNKRTTSQKESTEEDVIFIPEIYGKTIHI